jgi:type II secretory pathway pseudopilin PulG
MVVLALIAVLLAIAAPQFVRLYARARVAFEREDLERQLFELPEKVRTAGRAGVLADPRAPDSGSGGPGPGGADLEDPQRLSLDLPRDWAVEVPKPIFYHFTGACDGGEVIFSLPPLSLRYVLSPPLCRPRLADAP